MWWIATFFACRTEPAAMTCAEGGVDGVDGRVCTIAGIGANCYNGLPASALETCLFLPSAATFDPDGRFVLADFNNWRIIALDGGGFELLAGNGLHQYAVDGEPAVVSPLENPVDVLYDADGNLYILELHGARVLRVVDGLIDTYVGSELSPGYPGYSGDGGPAVDAQISEAFGMVMGDDGTLYIGDSGNDCVRAVSPDGIIRTLAGLPPPDITGTTVPPVEGPTLVDGVGPGAQFRMPWGMAIDGDWLYVADAYNNAVRRVDVNTGEVVTVAGTGTPGFSGDGGPAVDAELTEPVGVTVGPDGLLYIADSKNHVIRVVDEDGAIHTILGQPQVAGLAGDGTAPEDGEALLNWPNDVVFSPDGDMYVVDAWNGAVRKVRRYLP